MWRVDVLMATNIVLVLLSKLLQLLPIFKYRVSCLDALKSFVKLFCMEVQERKTFLSSAFPVPIKLAVPLGSKVCALHWKTLVSCLVWCPRFDHAIHHLHFHFKIQSFSVKYLFHLFPKKSLFVMDVRLFSSTLYSSHIEHINTDEDLGKNKDLFKGEPKAKIESAIQYRFIGNWKSDLTNCPPLTCNLRCRLGMASIYVCYQRNHRRTFVTVIKRSFIQRWIYPLKPCVCVNVESFLSHWPWNSPIGPNRKFAQKVSTSWQLDQAKAKGPFLKIVPNLFHWRVSYSAHSCPSVASMAFRRRLSSR